MLTRHAPEETRHRLIRTANLDLVERGLLPVAALGRTLHATLLRILPALGSAKDVVLLFALEAPAREDGLGDGVLVGAGAALETVGALRGEGDGEDVGAVWADWA
jgi:hypothetical protein